MEYIQIEHLFMKAGIEKDSFKLSLTKLSNEPAISITFADISLKRKMTMALSGFYVVPENSHWSPVMRRWRNETPKNEDGDFNMMVIRSPLYWGFIKKGEKYVVWNTPSKDKISLMELKDIVMVVEAHNVYEAREKAKQHAIDVKDMEMRGERFLANLCSISGPA